MTAHVGVTAAHQRRRDRARAVVRERFVAADTAFAELHRTIMNTTTLTISDDERALAQQLHQQFRSLMWKLTRP